LDGGRIHPAPNGDVAAGVASRVGSVLRNGMLACYPLRTLHGFTDPHSEMQMARPCVAVAECLSFFVCSVGPSGLQIRKRHAGRSLQRSGCCRIRKVAGFAYADQDCAIDWSQNLPA
jgi:hypothetical protein